MLSASTDQNGIPIALDSSVLPPNCKKGSICWGPTFWAVLSRWQQKQTLSTQTGSGVQLWGSLLETQPEAGSL